MADKVGKVAVALVAATLLAVVAMEAPAKYGYESLGERLAKNERQYESERSREINRQIVELGEQLKRTN